MDRTRPQARGVRHRALLLIVALCTCGTPNESTTVFTPAIHEIEYEYRWDWGEASPQDDGSWRVTTNQGYAIQVLSGAITHYSVQLVPCETRESAIRIDSLFGIAKAWAGHSDIAPDPSLMTQQHIQSLVNPEAVRTVNLTVKNHTYCQVHAVLGPADADANGLEKHGFMANKTLVLSGRYRAPNSPDEVPFHIESDLGIGEFMDWQSEPINMDESGVRVILTHRLDKLLDHIQWDTQHPNEIAWFIMTNAIKNTTIEIKRGTNGQP